MIKKSLTLLAVALIVFSIFIFPVNTASAASCPVAACQQFTYKDSKGKTTKYQVGSVCKKNDNNNYTYRYYKNNFSKQYKSSDKDDKKIIDKIKSSAKDARKKVAAECDKKNKSEEGIEKGTNDREDEKNSEETTGGGTQGISGNNTGVSWGEDAGGSFLGLVPWYQNVDIHDQDSLAAGIWTIATNILVDITIVAAYLVIGYVIYGGYQYVMSSGDPGKVANGRKTLAQAFIGLAIVMLANIILNTIRIALGASSFANCVTEECVDPNSMVTNAIQWVIGVAGFVSAIFVVYGGITYITSAGDPGKIQKAKQMITYALIGLAIVALAEIITAFVSGTIRNAETNASINETLISKEVYETHTY